MARLVKLLRTHGPMLARARADSVKGSRHSTMKELPLPGRPLRTLFVFGAVAR